MAKKVATTKKAVETKLSKKSDLDINALRNSQKFVAQAMDGIGPGCNERFHAMLSNVYKKMETVLTADSKKADKATERLKAKLAKLAEQAAAAGINIAELM